MPEQPGSFLQMAVHLHSTAVNAERGGGSTLQQHLSQVTEMGLAGGTEGPRTQSLLFPPDFFTRNTFWIATCLEMPLHMSYTVSAAVVTAVSASISTPARGKVANGALQICQWACHSPIQYSLYHWTCKASCPIAPGRAGCAAECSGPK